MFCPNCGKDIPEGSSFCPACGTRIALAGKVSDEDAIRNVLISRIDGIKNRDAKAIGALVLAESYTKFDDWPPFDLQDSEALKSEADALKVLKEYSYETRGWKIQTFGNATIATFIIRYKGKIRDLNFDVRSRITAFLLKQTDEWKIVHEHWSRFPKMAPPPPTPPNR